MRASADRPPEEREGILDGDEERRNVRLPSEDQAADSGISPAGKRRLAVAAVTLGGLMLATYFVPGLETIRPWRSDEGYIPFWNVVGREVLDQEGQAREHSAHMARLQAIAEQAADTDGAARDAVVTRAIEPPPTKEQTPTTEQELYPPYEPHADDEAKVQVAIDAVDRLAYFYSKLTLTDLRKSGAITRASHWGDSVLGGDGVTHAIRRRLQTRFGDAGHGFHALGRYNLAYSHRGIRFGDRGGWRTCEIIFKCERDGRYGYAGVSSTSSGGGTSRYRTAKKGFGSKVSRFEVWHATAPDGGRLQVKVDGEVERVIDTKSEVPGDAVATFSVSDGEHGFEVRAIGDGVARGYGVVLERDGPGVVWDELSLIGAFTQRLDYQDPEHIAWQVQRRDVDLMVFMFGGNDVQRQKMDLYRTMQPYEDEYTAVIQKFRKGKPDAACMIMSLVDHGERVGKHGIQTRRIVPQLVASQRRVALAEGCAFFNTFEAMGGDGSIGRWYHAEPRLANPDFAHPTVEGQEVIATLLYQALMKGYAEFRRAKAGQPLPVFEPPPWVLPVEARDAGSGN